MFWVWMLVSGLGGAVLGFLGLAAFQINEVRMEHNTKVRRIKTGRCGDCGSPLNPPRTYLSTCCHRIRNITHMRIMGDEMRVEYWQLVRLCLMRFSDYSYRDASFAVARLRDNVEENYNLDHLETYFQVEPYITAQGIATSDDKPFECKNYVKDYINGVLQDPLAGSLRK